MWQRRTSERAQPVVLGLFPSWAVDKRTIDAADAWLADESRPAALRRLVSEGRAGVIRALAAREEESRPDTEPDEGSFTISASCGGVNAIWSTGQDILPVAAG